MSMNLGNSLADEWDRRHRHIFHRSPSSRHDYNIMDNPYSLPQIDTKNSYEIYGDGVHEHICERLYAFYEKWTREMIEYEAGRKGVPHPFQSKERKYYERLLADELKNNWYMRNLENLKKHSANEITWYVS